MQLQYVLTLEDYVAFSVDQSRTIPAYRFRRRLCQILGFAVFAGCGIWKTLRSPQNSVLTVIAFAVLAVGWVALYGGYGKWNIRRQYAAYFRNPENTQRLGPRKMILDGDKMILRMEEGQEETVALSGVTRLTSDQGHFFLYFGDDTGMPVPYTAFSSKAEAQRFLKRIRAEAPALNGGEE